MEHHHNDHAAHLSTHGAAEGFLRRFWIVTALLFPLFLSQPQLSAWLGWGEFAFRKWLQFGLATIIFGFALVFFQHAWHEIKTKRYGMMTLVALAVGSGYLFSVASTFLPQLEVEFYIEISTLIWVLLFGHFLEARSSSVAGDALKTVAKLLPKQAHKLQGEQTIDVPVDELQVGDLVVVKPGEKIPADGVIESGSANVNEALLTGESIPLEKTKGNEVVAGAICIDGSLTVRLTRVGENSTVGQIKQLVEQAGRTKPRSARLADKAAVVLTITAGLTAVGTLLVWTLIMGEPFAFAMTLAITVLVIACPHALGLAIPTVSAITTSLAIKNGFFIKDMSKLEVIRRTDWVVLDKTGTLTEGEFGVSTTVVFGDIDRDEMVSIIASLEQPSSHMIALSIVQYAKEQGLSTRTVTDFKNVAGHGVQGSIDGHEYYVGNAAFMRSLNLSVEAPAEQVGTLVYVADKQAVLGYLVLSDSIKESSATAVAVLHRLGVKVAMLTGDNEKVAKQVADELKIDTYFADVLPEDKYSYIKQLQTEGNVVLMVGDGVNDAPALTQADAGVAIGAGTDLAVAAGDIILTDNDPEDVARLIKLSRLVYVKMIQNLVWALGYNVVAIPAAAGLFAAWGFFLQPSIGALVMSLSTVIVVLNALTLRRIKLA